MQPNRFATAPATAGCLLKRSSGPFSNRFATLAGDGMSPTYSNPYFIIARDYFIRLRNSLRVRSSRRKIPLKADVVVTALAFCTPRRVMQV